MTSQEISDFVNQRAPREIPKSVLAKVGMSNKYTSLPFGYHLLFFLTALYLLSSGYIFISGRAFISTLAVPIFLLSDWFIHRKKIRFLRDGIFVTGRVSEVRVKPWRIFPPPTLDAVIAVSFSAPNGTERTGRYKIWLPSHPECRQWAAEGRSVGLLFLPDREDIIITDFWVEEQTL
jgi:hypothetical protein